MAGQFISGDALKAKVFAIFDAVDGGKTGLVQGADALEDIFRKGGLLYEQTIPPRQVA